MSDSIRLDENQIRQLREKELELLQIFISVCEKLGLKYFIVEGTLLGAVRHKGFIPWDDDIDVGMTRSDYEVFLKKAPALLPDGFFLQTRYTDPQYPQCFAKLRNSNTVFLETTYINLDINHGIYIDIFPFDYYPESTAAGLWFDFSKLLVSYRVREVYYLPSDSRFTAANIVRRIITLFSKLRFKTVTDALEYQERLIKGVKPSPRMINNGSPWKNRERISAEWICETTELSFEGVSVKAPSEYDKYLRHLYGDYMQLPPKEKQQPHHYVSKIGF